MLQLAADRSERIRTDVLSIILMIDLIVYVGGLYLSVRLGSLDIRIVITNFEKLAWTLQESLQDDRVRCRLGFLNIRIRSVKVTLTFV